MGPEAAQGPYQIGVGVDAEVSAGCHDSKECGHSMCTLGAPSEETIMPKLGDVLVFALGGRVIDRDLGMIDEAKERVPVGPIIADDFGDVIVRRESRLDRVHPLKKILLYRRDLLPSPFPQRIFRQSCLTRLLFDSIDRSNEVASFGGQSRLLTFGVPQLAATVSIASGLDDVARLEDWVVAMLGVGN